MSMYGKYAGKTGPLDVKDWPVTDCSKDKGFTVQGDRDDADINRILARFQKSGQLPPTLRGEPFYGDVSEFGNLQESLIQIQEAEDLFMQYPAEVRERFGNDPLELIEFLADEGNRAEAESLGLVVARPKPAEPAAPVPPVAPAEPVEPA